MASAAAHRRRPTLRSFSALATRTEAHVGQRSKLAWKINSKVEQKTAQLKNGDACAKMATDGTIMAPETGRAGADRRRVCECKDCDRRCKCVDSLGDPMILYASGPWMSPNHINLYGLVTSMAPDADTGIE